MNSGQESGISQIWDPNSGRSARVVIEHAMRRSVTKGQFRTAVGSKPLPPQVPGYKQPTVLESKAREEGIAVKPDGGAAVEFHVLPYGHRWTLSRDGQRMGIFDTKQQTIEEACQRARAEELSSIVVHDSQGHVQHKDDTGCTDTLRDFPRQ